jgi:hypothetical protein
MNKLSHFLYWLLIAKKNSGLLPTPEDFRDFQTGIFGWGTYTPKHTRKINQTLSVKNQRNLNTCQWNATTAQKEPDEDCLLSTRLLVAKGKKMGLVEGDGFSNLRSGQKVLQDYGAVEEGLFTEPIINGNIIWDEYIRLNPDLYTDRASKHKISSFWAVSSRNDLLKLLDEGRIIATGTMWYSGFNQGGGFSSPWIISSKVGYQIGGHAFVIVGYDLNYHGKKVYICQNSYGKEWGDKGLFYVTMDYMDGNNYGYYTNLDDVDKELGKFINDYDGQNVRGKGTPGIFHIQNGKKKAYPNMETFLAWNGKRRGFVEVDKAILDKVENGDIMDIKKSDYWTFLKDVQEANRLDALIQLIYKND